jgi:hypothetical protein
MLQMMQIVGERNVRVVPDVSVNGANGGNGLLDGMLGLLVREKAEKPLPAAAAKVS